MYFFSALAGKQNKISAVSAISAREKNLNSEDDRGRKSDVGMPQTQSDLPAIAFAQAKQAGALFKPDTAAGKLPPT
jgi:hypothetical protein